MTNSNRDIIQEDIIGQLGNLAFASRLKRLSERLMRDVSRIYKAEQLNFEARWFPIFYLLWRQSPLAVTAIAQRLHLTHPAVNQVAGAMTKAGLISSARDRKDDRRRLLSLTPAGKKLAIRLTPIWSSVQEATSELVAGTQIDLLGALHAIEKSLDECDLYERVRLRLKQQQYDEVEIINYEPRLARQFRKLNLEWLRKYFKVEPADREFLDDPDSQILARGGRIVFARLKSRVVGTAALIRLDSATWELAKMAVTENSQGLQVGKRLAVAVIDLAKASGARTLILHTSPKLVAANALYRQLGFAPTTTDRSKTFRRPTIAMKLNLKNPTKHRDNRGPL
jgi:DNA-binding MarR family transcriptional regulator